MQVLADRPDAADQYAFSVEDGDVILLATDGIFDNVPDRLLVEEMDKVQHCKDEVILQQSANTIALMARRLSRDSQVTFAFNCFITFQIILLFTVPISFLNQRLSSWD